jgi:rhomboid family GlyGly-CTERM serine protease
VKRPGSLLASLNCDGKPGVALLACLAVLVALACGGPPLTGLLRYERGAIAHGEWWRLVSAHWVHLGPRHLLPDAAGLVLLWVLYARELRPLSWLLVLAGATAAIDAGLWWGPGDIEWYAGISGLLHGAWAAGSVAVARKGGPTGWVMLAALAVKLAVEHFTGARLFTSGFPVVPVAHLYGALGALLAVAALALARKPL